MGIHVSATRTNVATPGEPFFPFPQVLEQAGQKRHLGDAWIAEAKPYNRCP